MLNVQELDLSKFVILDDDDLLDDDDVYQQLAKKDKFLALAAEAGKTLLEKNRNLESTIEYMNAEMNQKIEELESANYKLKSCYSHRETDYQMQLHNLRYDYEALLKEHKEVKRNKKLSVENNANEVKDLLNQIEVMREKLEIANFKSNEFSLEVQTLKRRIEGRTSATTENYTEDVNMMELKMANEQIKILRRENRTMQETLDRWASEKMRFIEEAEKFTDKISMLEQKNKYLEQQISIAKSDLDVTKNSNVLLKEQLEEYIVQVSTSGFKASNSLMSELEKSLVHENDTKYFDESMQDSNHFVPISISSPIKPNVPFTQMGRQDNLLSDLATDESDALDPNTPERQESVHELKRQIAELNQKFNESLKSYVRLTTKYSLTTNRLKFAEIKLEEMQQQINCLNREVELYKSEREVIFSESSLDEALSLSLEKQRKAYEERNHSLEKLEETKSDLAKLNGQLLEAVRQKIYFAEQVEKWQADVAALIDRQLKIVSKSERKEKSRSAFFPVRRSWTLSTKPT